MMVQTIAVFVVLLGLLARASGLPMPGFRLARSWRETWRTIVRACTWRWVVVDASDQLWMAWRRHGSFEFDHGRRIGLIRASHLGWYRMVLLLRSRLRLRVSTDDDAAVTPTGLNSVDPTASLAALLTESRADTDHRPAWLAAAKERAAHPTAWLVGEVWDDRQWARLGQWLAEQPRSPLRAMALLAVMVVLASAAMAVAASRVRTSPTGWQTLVGEPLKAVQACYPVVRGARDCTVAEMGRLASGLERWATKRGQKKLIAQGATEVAQSLRSFIDEPVMRLRFRLAPQADVSLSWLKTGGRRLEQRTGPSYTQTARWAPGQAISLGAWGRRNGSKTYRGHFALWRMVDSANSRRCWLGGAVCLSHAAFVRTEKERLERLRQLITMTNQRKTQ